MLFFILNREDFSFVIHLDRQPRTSRRREAQTGSRARSERTLDAVEHSRTLMEWWPFLIFHRGGLRIKVINNTKQLRVSRPKLVSFFAKQSAATVLLEALRLGSLLGKDVATVGTRRRPAPTSPRKAVSTREQERPRGHQSFARGLPERGDSFGAHSSPCASTPSHRPIVPVTVSI